MWQIIGDIHIDSKEETIQEKINNLRNMLNNDYNNVILLGDVFHIRNHVSTFAINLLQNLFEEFKDKHFYIIVGNHDCKYKNTLHPNSIETCLGWIKNVTVIDKPTNIDNFLLIPWICDLNYIDCIDAIKKSKQKYCCGHFAINTFLMTRGIECRSSLKISDFDHFEKVFSGHFHLRQEKKNIIYVGSTTQETWTDYQDQKGYYVVDKDVKFIEGPKQIYKHLVLDDNKTKFKLDDYSDCHIKIYHSDKLSKKQFDMIEELKLIIRSYQIFDETNIDIKEVKFEKIEFSEMLTEFFNEQEEMENDFKTNIMNYLIMKHKEIG